MSTLGWEVGVLQGECLGGLEFVGMGWGERVGPVTCHVGVALPVCVRAPAQDTLTTWQVGHRLSGTGPGWGERRLFTPCRRLLRQMYQVNAQIAAFKKKSIFSPCIGHAHLFFRGTHDLDGAPNTPAFLRPFWGLFPAGLSVHEVVDLYWSTLYGMQPLGKGTGICKAPWPPRPAGAS